MNSLLPPPDGSCPFMNIPGELRNKIYEFALTDVHPLLHRLGHFYKSRLLCDFNHEESQEKRELNQLQYVSWQLRYETKGLELRYNDIVFQQEYLHPPISQFLRFFQLCSPRHRDEIRNVIIGHSLIEGFPRPECPMCPPRLIHRIIELCKLYPLMNISIRLMELDLNNPCGISHVVRRGLAVKAAFRGADWDAWVWGDLASLVDQWRCLRALDDINVSNFRFLPVQTSLSASERRTQMFRLVSASIRHPWPVSGFIIMFGSVDKLMDEVEDWFVNGI